MCPSQPTSQATTHLMWVYKLTMWQQTWPVLPFLVSLPLEDLQVGVDIWQRWAGGEAQSNY
jgi:hypothetical protein